MADENVVDWDVDELHEEADETHDEEADGSCDGNLGEFCGEAGRDQNITRKHMNNIHS